MSDDGVAKQGASVTAVVEPEEFGSESSYPRGLTSDSKYFLLLIRGQTPVVGRGGGGVGVLVSGVGEVEAGVAAPAVVAAGREVVEADRRALGRH